MGYSWERQGRKWQKEAKYMLVAIGDIEYEAT